MQYVLAIAGPGAIHLLNGLYDAKADNTPVIAITGGTSTDLMNSSFQQDINLLQLFSDVTVYNSIIGSPQQAEMAVDIAFRTALTKGVSHLNIPIDARKENWRVIMKTQNSRTYVRYFCTSGFTG